MLWVLLLLGVGEAEGLYRLLVWFCQKEPACAGWQNRRVWQKRTLCLLWMESALWSAQLGWKGWEGIAVGLFFSLLAMIAWMDWITMKLLDVSIYALLLFWPLFADVGWAQRVIGLCFPAVLLILCNRLWKECFGGGDVLLCAVGGFLAGAYRFVLALALTLSLAGILVSLLLVFRRVSLQSKIPFAPWLTLSIAIALWLPQLGDFGLLI